MEIFLQEPLNRRPGAAYFRFEEPHGSTFNHPGEEFVYVLEGGLVVTLDGREYFVEAGNCIQYPSTIIHSWRNPMKQAAKLISITTPLIF